MGSADPSGNAVGAGRIAALAATLPDRDASGTAEVELDGRRHLVGERALLDGLRLVAIVPEEALDAGAGRLGVIVASVTAAAIVLTSLLSLLLLRSVVLVPIQRLRRSAVAIGQGRLDTPIELGRDDEIGDLATAFGEMTGRLSESIGELRRSRAKIERLAYRDSLSGLANRRAFLERVERAVAVAGPGDARLAVLFLDLDGFKRLNDSEGHAAGDRLLRAVADPRRTAAPAHGVGRAALRRARASGTSCRRSRPGRARRAPARAA